MGGTFQQGSKALGTRNEVKTENPGAISLAKPAFFGNHSHVDKAKPFSSFSEYPNVCTEFCFCSMSFPPSLSNLKPLPNKPHPTQQPFSFFFMGPFEFNYGCLYKHEQVVSYWNLSSQNCSGKKAVVQPPQLRHSIQPHCSSLPCLPSRLVPCTRATVELRDALVLNFSCLRFLDSSACLLCGKESSPAYCKTLLSWRHGINENLECISVIGCVLASL